ncbi:MAG: hypothetical protein E3J46_02540 [Desulfobacteraceae bacterium]|nr:MAG: hypothetical protein E3J46_02540 [Desulfobacteraceae bacterium]
MDNTELAGLRQKAKGIGGMQPSQDLEPYALGLAPPDIICRPEGINVQYCFCECLESKKDTE